MFTPVRKDICRLNAALILCAIGVGGRLGGRLVRGHGIGRE